MKLPLPLTVAGPAAREHVPALSLATGLIVLQVGVVLLFPWPLALAIDHADVQPLSREDGILITLRQQEHLLDRGLE